MATTAAAAAEAHARLHAALNWQLGGAAAAQAEALRLEARLVWALLRAARAASAAEGGDNQLAGAPVLSVPRPPCAAADEVAGLPAALEHAVGWLRATPKLCEGVDALGVRLVLLRQALSLVATHGLGLGLGLGGEAGRRLEGETVGGPRHVAMLDAGEGALREAARRVAAEREAAAEEARREAAAAAAAAEEAAAAAGKPKPKARGQAAPPPPDHGALVWRSAFEISELVHSLQVEAEEGARLGAAQAHQLLYKLGPMEADAAAAAAAAAEASTDASPLEQPRARRSRRPSSERDISPVTPRAIGSAGASSVASAQSGQRPAVSSAQAHWLGLGLGLGLARVKPDPDPDPNPNPNQAHWSSATSKVVNSPKSSAHFHPPSLAPPEQVVAATLAAHRAVPAVCMLGAELCSIRPAVEGYWSRALCAAEEHTAELRCALRLQRAHSAARRLAHAHNRRALAACLAQLAAARAPRPRRRRCCCCARTPAPSRRAHRPAGTRVAPPRAWRTRRGV